MFAHQEPYEANEDGVPIWKMAIAVLRCLRASTLLPASLKLPYFRTAVWKLSERDGKYSTRFRSMKALEAMPHEIQHEHIFPIRFLFEQFISGRWNEHHIAHASVACLVTIPEHQRLSSDDRDQASPVGWQRYVKAGIMVRDMMQDKECDLQIALPQTRGEQHEYLVQEFTTAAEELIFEE